MQFVRARKRAEKTTEAQGIFSLLPPNRKTASVEEKAAKHFPPSLYLALLLLKSCGREDNRGATKKDDRWRIHPKSPIYINLQLSKHF